MSLEKIVSQERLENYITLGILGEELVRFFAKNIDIGKNIPDLYSGVISGVKYIAETGDVNPALMALGVGTGLYMGYMAIKFGISMPLSSMLMREDDRGKKKPHPIERFYRSMTQPIVVAAAGILSFLHYAPPIINGWVDVVKDGVDPSLYHLLTPTINSEYWVAYGGGLVITTLVSASLGKHLQDLPSQVRAFLKSRKTPEYTKLKSGPLVQQESESISSKDDNYWTLAYQAVLKHQPALEKEYESNPTIETAMLLSELQLESVIRQSILPFKEEKKKKPRDFSRAKQTYTMITNSTSALAERVFHAIEEHPQFYERFYRPAAAYAEGAKQKIDYIAEKALLGLDHAHHTFGDLTAAWKKLFEPKRELWTTELGVVKEDFNHWFYEAITQYTNASWGEQEIFTLKNKKIIGKKQKRLERLGEKGNVMLKQMTMFYDIINGRNEKAIKNAEAFVTEQKGASDQTLEDIFTGLEDGKYTIAQARQKEIEARDKGAAEFAMIAKMMNYVKKQGYKQAEDVEKNAVIEMHDVARKDKRKVLKQIESRNLVYTLGPEKYLNNYVFKQYLGGSLEERTGRGEQEVEYNKVLERRVRKMNRSWRWRIEKGSLKGYGVVPIITFSEKDSCLITERIEGKTLLQTIEAASIGQRDDLLRHSMILQANAHSVYRAKGQQERDHLRYVEESLLAVPGFSRNLVAEVVRNYAPIIEMLTEKHQPRGVLMDAHTENTIMGADGIMYTLDTEGNRIGAFAIDAAKKLYYGPYKKDDEKVGEAEKRRKEHCSTLLKTFKKYKPTQVTDDQFRYATLVAAVDNALASIGSLDQRSTKLGVRTSLITNGIFAIGQIEQEFSNEYRQSKNEYAVFQKALDRLLELEMVNQQRSV